MTWNGFASALCALIAVEHALFLVLEMFFWNRPLGRRVFGLTREFAEQSRGLAANQGLYNGFLAAGLAGGLIHPDPAVAAFLKSFFLICVFVAGVFGGFTAKRSIWFVQALPALLALSALGAASRVG